MSAVILTVDLVIVRPAAPSMPDPPSLSDFRFLLIKRRKPPFEGQWALPGGKVEEQDRWIEFAALRELREETSIQLSPHDLRLVGVFQNPGRDPRGDVVTCVYLAQVPADCHAHAGDDAAEARWYALDELPRPLAFDHEELIKAALALLP